MRKPTIWVPTRSDTYRTVSHRRWLEAGNLGLERRGLFYPCSENKGADQLHSYCEADLRLVFANADCWFPHAVAKLYSRKVVGVKSQV